MITEEVRAAEAKLVRRGVGLGGACRAAAAVTVSQCSGKVAHEALDTWHERSCAFPYAEIVKHVRAVGRLHMAPSLTRRLCDIPTSRRDSLLSAWLPMTHDQVDGGYATYAGLIPHQTVTRTSGRPDRARLDELTVAILGELAREEAAAVDREARAPEVRARLRATARLLARAGDLAPGHPVEPALTEDVSRALSQQRGPLGSLADVTERAAKVIQGQVSSEVGNVVAHTALPMSRLHDEFMFIRGIQVFESLYEQIGLAVTEARDAILDDGPCHGARALDSVVERMKVLPAMFRLLGTMPVASFAVIRGYTHGRSAIQSLAYRKVEAACSRHLQAVPSGARTVRYDGASLEDAYQSVRTHPEAELLAAALRRLDAAWRGMKRSHWGITLRIIGNVPGTGGTSGASYLKVAADTPLFPALAREEDR